ncbi:HAT dimerization domain-containing protein-like [Rhynchospora pubera]|uniref:HAT dimerization domain-containing protein-like n=1 Tax=Rhynchospora pubera TaxID=906938 RepID=A0AAV8FEK5_9POAL|nr:HAT dimerization domain-containing protein-like [Rhynchospora pubera]
MAHNSTPSVTDSIASDGSSSFNASTPLWQYVTRLEKAESGGNTKFTCNFCKVTFTGSYSRVKAHLFQISGTGIRACKKITKEELARLKKLQEEVDERAKAVIPREVPRPSDGKIPTSLETRSVKKRAMTQLEKSWAVAARNEIDEEVARIFYTGCPSFNLAKNPHFIKSYVMLSESGIKGYKPPSYNKIRTTLLDRERVHVDRLLQPIRSTWARKGVSIVCDGWTDVQRRPLINFIAITDGLPMFLKAYNCQGERFWQVKRGLKELVIREDWNEYQEDNIDKANFVREKVLDETGFWKKIEFILEFTEPIYEMLRITDTDKPCLHLVYEMWDNMIDKVKDIIYKHEGKSESEDSPFFNVVKTILTDRWAKSNTPLHCLAYSLNPRYSTTH